MKTAQGKYNQAGTEITLNIYFDLKVFDLISPSMANEEENEFIRVIYDSLAAALPQQTTEKTIYIKRIIKQSSNVLKLLCTDGFLIDDALSIPTSQQAFAKERIKITDINQLPTRLNFSNDLLKNIHDKLSLFEKEIRISSTPDKSPAASIHHNNLLTAERELELDKAFDLLAEIARVKKDIKGITEYNKTSFSYDSFSHEADEIVQRVTQQTNTFALLKQHLISCLYESAKQYREIILKKMQNAAPHIKKNLMMEFNKKFYPIAAISESGELSSLEESQATLGKLSLSSLEKIISNNEKETLGLLQKCNTSWTDESPELQIVLKNLGQLNKTLSSLFKDDAQFTQYANKEMIQIIRIPFPRGYQFKFSNNTANYIKSIENFCKSQKESLLALEQKYKKTAQEHTHEAAKQTPSILTNTHEQVEFVKKTNEKSSIHKKDEKIKPTEEPSKTITQESGPLPAVTNTPSIYETIMDAVKKINSTIAQNHTLTQRNEAKNLLLQLIKKQHDPISVKDLDKHILDLYTQLDAHTVELERIINYLTALKKEMFTNLDHLANIPQEEIDAKLQTIPAKLEAMTSEKLVIEKSLSDLKKLTFNP